MNSRQPGLTQDPGSKKKNVLRIGCKASGQQKSALRSKGSGAQEF